MPTISRAGFVTKLDKAVGEILAADLPTAEMIAMCCQENGLLMDHDMNDVFILDAIHDIVQITLVADQPLNDDPDYIAHVEAAWQAFNRNQLAGK
jgi:hypothetical protein